MSIRNLCRLRTTPTPRSKVERPRADPGLIVLIDFGLSTLLGGGGAAEDEDEDEDEDERFAQAAAADIWAVEPC